MPLDPKARALLDMVYRVGAPRFAELDERQARHSFEKLIYAFAPDAPPVASVTEVPITRADHSALLARLYRPLQAPAGQVLPLLLFFHGGGWCIGDVSTYDVLCRELANGSGAAVLSVDYRLAPEHPFPAAFLDARLALEWAAANGGLLGIDPARIGLGGDSAGGNLSLALALDWRDRPAGPPLRHLALVYPCTEILSERPSRERFAEGYFLDRDSLAWFFARYRPDDSDWRASPMRAASLARLPPMTLLTAEFDPLVDDCLAFAARVRNEGGAVEHRAYDGMVHGFITLGGHFPQANEAVAQLAEAVALAL